MGMHFFVAYCIVFSIFLATTKNPGIAIPLGLVAGILANRIQRKRKKKAK
jgi:hypothetical protein